MELVERVHQGGVTLLTRGQRPDHLTRLSVGGQLKGEVVMITSVFMKYGVDLIRMLLREYLAEASPPPFFFFKYDFMFFFKYFIQTNASG